MKTPKTSKASETAKEVVSALNRAIDRSHKDFVASVVRKHAASGNNSRGAGK